MRKQQNKLESPNHADKFVISQSDEATQCCRCLDSIFQNDLFLSGSQTIYLPAVGKVTVRIIICQRCALHTIGQIITKKQTKSDHCDIAPDEFGL